jgi:glutamate 5-kinase
VISILDEAGEEFARGIVNYSSGQAAQIAGLRSDRVEELVGSDEELVTRDNIALLEELHAA